MFKQKPIVDATIKTTIQNQLSTAPNTSSTNSNNIPPAPISVKNEGGKIHTNCEEIVAAIKKLEEELEVWPIVDIAERVPETPSQVTAQRIITIAINRIGCSPENQLPITSTSKASTAQFKLSRDIIEGAMIYTTQIYKWLCEALQGEQSKCDFIIPTLTELFPPPHARGASVEESTLPVIPVDDVEATFKQIEDLTPPPTETDMGQGSNFLE